jgi:hypothetical protein
MKIRQLIEKLEEIEKHCNKAAHGEPRASITLDFKDPELDSKYFYGEITEVCESITPGCGSPWGANLLIEISE